MAVYGRCSNGSDWKAGKRMSACVCTCCNKRREQNKAWERQNKKHLKDYRLEYYEKNKEKMRKYQRSYYLKNQAKILKEKRDIYRREKGLTVK